MRTPELKTIDVKLFTGLEVETDELARTPNSWQRLEQWDQFVSGAIRKVKGLEPIVTGIFYDKPISAITRWRRSPLPTDSAIVVGISQSGQLFNLETGAPLGLANAELTSPAFLGEMTGLANNGADTIKYLVIVNGSVPQKFDGTSVTIIGTPAPTSPVMIAGAVLVQDPTLGISVLVSRKYRFTWWNPDTKHESSPSPDSPESPASSTDYSFISQTSAVHATDTFPYISEIALDGRFLLTAGVPSPGYTKIRIWATRDGGDVFYLVKPLIGVVDRGGGLFAYSFSDSDGALIWSPIEGPLSLILDGSMSGAILPNLQFGPFVSAGGNLIYNITTPYPPVPDPALVQPAPDPGENDPPPAATWAAIYQGRLFLVPYNNQSQLVFSNLENFQSFAPDNRFQLEDSQDDPVIALDGQYAQLIVGKKESSDQITGVDFTDFILAPLDTQINFVSRRGLIHAGSVMFFLSRQGIMVLQGPQPEFYGKPIRTITDTIVFPEDAIMAVHSKRGIALLYAELPTAHTLFLIDYSQPSPFSTMVLPLAATAMMEVELSDGSTEVLVALEDNVVYKLWKGDRIGGFDIVATAVTQLMPQDELQYRKQFRRLRVTETPRGLVFRCSVDGVNFTPYQDVRQMAPIGLTGLQLTIEFAHADTQPGEIVLSNYLVEYTVLGEARDYGR